MGDEAEVRSDRYTDKLLRKNLVLSGGITLFALFHHMAAIQVAKIGIDSGWERNRIIR
ncbi:hypothetical protein OE750_12110 [Lentibacter sp. XHP0401]|nr:hypothetical protein [Lentibacter sp. XHP0401]